MLRIRFVYLCMSDIFYVRSNIDSTIDQYFMLDLYYVSLLSISWLSRWTWRSLLNNTAQPRSKRLLPVFSSSLNFNGISYTGGHGRNKKEAEQLATQAVIISLLGIFFLYDFYEVFFIQFWSFFTALSYFSVQSQLCRKEKILK